jgi:rod shape-determining protein MreC
MSFRPRSFLSLFGPLFFLIGLIFFFSFFFSRPLTWLVQPLAWFGISVNNFSATADCQLSAALANLVIDQTELSTLKAENFELKKQLNFFEHETVAHVTARIVNRSASPIDETFIIDRGANDGIKENTAVIVSDGYIIGRVVKVSNQTSVVRSLLSRASKITAATLNSSRTIGLAEGTGGALLSLNFIPQDQTINIGDLIVTSGLETNLPAGLILGVITSVVHDPAAPFQTATIEQVISSQNSQLVSVIIPPSD